MSVDWRTVGFHRAPQPSSWLCRGPVEHARFLAVQRVIVPAHMKVLAMMALLILPVLPWCRTIAIVPVLMALVLYSYVQQAAMHLRRPEVAIAAGVVVAQALLTAAIVINGSQHDAGLIILIWPVIAAGSRFPTRVLWAGAVYTAGLMAFAALAFDGSAVRSDPLLLTLPLAALFSITSMSAVGRD